MAAAARLRLLSVLIGCVAAFAVGEVAIRIYAARAFAYRPGDDAPILSAAEFTVTSRHDELGWELRANVEGTFLGGRFATNSRGLRDDEHPLAKPPGVFRIVGIGDSVMMGWGVAQEEAYLARLETKLAERCAGTPAVETINFGVHGYNAIQQYFVLKDRALAYDPDLIVLGYVGNDQEPTQFRKPKLRVATPSWLLNFVASQVLRLFGVIERGTTLNWRTDPHPRDFVPANFEEALAGILSLANERDIPLLVVLDSRYEWSAGMAHAQVAAFGRRFGADSIDLYASMRDLPAGTPVRVAISTPDAHNLRYLIALGPNRDHHGNALWHETVADLVLARVATRGWIEGCGS